MTPKLIVEVASGPQRNHKACVDPGASLLVGREPRSGLAVPSDAQLFAHHFDLGWSGEVVTLRSHRAPANAPIPSFEELEGAGENPTADIELEGLRVAAVRFRPRSWIRAGATTFLVDDEDREPVDAPCPAAAAALEALQGETAPLFAVLDCARGHAVRNALHRCPNAYRSLYDGRSAEAFDDVAPCVVELPKGSPLLPRLVLGGFRRRWGVFIAFPGSLASLRRHLRTLLFATDAETGDRLYFRFYDPRVLGWFLPMATPRQRALIFGPCDALWLESRGVLERHVPMAETPR